LNGREVIVSEGKTILGADDKAGIALAVALVEQFANAQFMHNRPLELLFSVQEEIGLLGAKAFEVSRLKSPFALILDGDGPLGEIYTQGLSQIHLELNIRPTGVANAVQHVQSNDQLIRQAMTLVASLPTGRLSPDTTANWGILSMGENSQLTLYGEARSHAPDALSALEMTLNIQIEAWNLNSPGFFATLQVLPRYSGFCVPPQHPEVQSLIAVGRTLGVNPKPCRMNIGSDAHILNERNIPAVVMAMGFRLSHSFGEVLDIGHYLACADWVKRWLEAE
jgi:tripeptide aminopeptidase